MVENKIRKHFTPLSHCLTDNVGEANKVLCAHKIISNDFICKFAFIYLFFIEIMWTPRKTQHSRDKDIAFYEQSICFL